MKQWTTKPTPGTRVNTGHPLAQGLLLDMPFNEGGGLVLRDSIGSNHAALDSGTLWKSDRFGLNAQQPSAARLGVLPVSSSWQPASAITVVAIATLNTTDSTNMLLSCEEVNNGFGFYFAATNELHAYIRIGAAWSDIVSTVMTVGRPTLVAMTYDGSTHRAYADQTNTNSASTSGSIVYSATQPLYFGAYSAGAPAWVAINLFRIYNRALSTSEINATYLNPWQIYATPRVTRPLFGVSSGAAPTPRMMLLGVG